jgi:uncharacterized protein
LSFFCHIKVTQVSRGTLMIRSFFHLHHQGQLAMSAIITPAPAPAIEFIDADDQINNLSNNEHFDSVLQARIARRSMFKGAIGTGASAIMGSIALSACGGSNSPAPAPATPAPPPAALKPLGFTAVAKNLTDTVTVPAGYTSTTLYRTGDPIAAGIAAYKNDGTDTDMEMRSGDCHDGIEYYGLNAAGTARDPLGSTRGLLAMNHEYMTPVWLHPNGPTTGIRPKAEVDKEVAVHGCAVIEVVKGADGKWTYPVDSKYNRRITPTTTMELSGPLRSNAAMKTSFSKDGTQTRGTQNNCGTGYSYWGTFLTCEENWAGYFFRAVGDDAKRSAKEIVSIKRYGRGKALDKSTPPVEINVNSRYGWEADRTGDLYQRWDMSSIGASADGTDDYRNIANTFGFVVEIDPYDKTAPIKKRTAMGRFAHEAAVMPKLVQGKPVAVYMGDDSQNEYIYKYVSTATWNAADANATNRMAIGDKYLDAGKLYVAQFNANGTGSWIELNISNPLISGPGVYAFTDQADVLINARLAADAVGATKMDRPEWGAVNPKNNDVYMTLTNNSSRTAAGTDAANPRAYSDVKGTATNNGNVNGHIIRFSETGGEPSATSFNWDVYLFGAQADADAATVNLSGLTADNDFSSPDGLWFSEATGFSWVQTDDGNYTDVTNCMLLAGMAGTRGDGVKTTVNYPATATTAAKAVDTYVGKKPTAAELKRFLVGPNECEITGITETPDGKAIFVNVQHPGENTPQANLADPTKWTSYWPDAVKGAAGAVPKRPRSATIVVTKDDGGQVGFG